MAGWQPVLSALVERRRRPPGAVPAGTLYAGYAPAGSFALTVDGHAVARRPAFGWAAQYAVGAKGQATLSLSQFPFVPLAVLARAGGLGAAGRSPSSAGRAGRDAGRRRRPPLVADDPTPSARR